MRCIFCKVDSSSSRSVEHIIPESLGNIDHVLPPGIVCDKCNNYISREVEKPFLDSRYIQERRFNFGIPSKKKRIPPMEGFHLQTSTLIHLLKVDGEEGISVCAGPNTDESRWVNSLLSSKAGTLILPIGEKPSDKVVSRFIGKVGLEVLAHRALDDPEILDEIVNKTELDQLRDYVRMVTVSRN
ncbi:MAG TPA: HNH endonuclease, partial [Planctomycetaceae bacterium]|nr:HNH endonuclease [Planctomycetaceae bacterium]